MWCTIFLSAVVCLVAVQHSATAHRVSWATWLDGLYFAVEGEGGRLLQSSGSSSSVNPKPSWCVALKGIDDSTLQSALDYACGQTTADCTAIKYGHLCFLRNTVFDHASYVFNSYYQINAKGANTCNFGGAAQITMEDPSHGMCFFPSSGSLNQTSRSLNSDANKLAAGLGLVVLSYLTFLLV